MFGGVVAPRVDEVYTHASQSSPQFGPQKNRPNRNRVAVSIRVGNADYKGHREVVGAASIRRKYVGNREYVDIPTG